MKTIVFNFKKALDYYNAGVVTVNLKVVRLAPGKYLTTTAIYYSSVIVKRIFHYLFCGINHRCVGRGCGLAHPHPSGVHSEKSIHFRRFCKLLVHYLRFNFKFQ
jgi:hypothetical protein